MSAQNTVESAMNALVAGDHARYLDHVADNVGQVQFYCAAPVLTAVGKAAHSRQLRWLNLPSIDGVRGFSVVRTIEAQGDGMDYVQARVELAHGAKPGVPSEVLRLDALFAVRHDRIQAVASS